MVQHFKFFFLCIVIFQSLNVHSQSYGLEEINKNVLRDQQLLGNFDSAASFCNSDNRIVSLNKVTWLKSSVKILPIILNQQLNTSNPFGWNDGAMQKSRGYQFFARAGLNYKYGIFEIQMAPEFLFVNNSSFKKIYTGQSFFKTHLGSISLGASSENLWWGPGINSSLLMSNNAPGFFHFFIGSNKPLKSAIGHFDFKLIGARLTSDKRIPYENYHNRLRNINDDWRFLSAYTLSWQPKWIKGLFLGMNRSLQLYGQDLHMQQGGILNTYIPVLGLAFQRKNNRLEDSINRDQVASFFLRWIFPKSQSELYVEFGKNDYGVNFRDYLLAPSHSYAYTIGFRKLFPKSKRKYILLETELTQMSQSPDHLVRGAGNWYEHSRIYQGYTNQNQILGTGAGFGVNLQTAMVTWINGEIRNGFLIQRIERDPVGRVNKWTDFSIGWMPQWKYKNMFIGAKVQLIRSNNYNWEKDNNSFNLHSRLMIQYNFK